MYFAFDGDRNPVEHHGPDAFVRVPAPHEAEELDLLRDRSVARGDAHPEKLNEPEWIGAHKYLKRSGTGLSAVVKLAALAGLWDSAPDATRR
jgi:hypothetical protein